MKSLLLLSLVSSALAVCPSGTIYESLFNKCYKFVPQATSFLQAEKSCNSLGGSLVSVSGIYENSYISGIVAATNPTASYWIGTNLLLYSRWSWSSGDNSTYMNFASGQPIDPSIYQCGASRASDNQWTKELCSSARPYVCQMNPNAAPINNCGTTPTIPPTTSTPSPVGSSCPTGYCLIPTYVLNPATCKCYKFYQGFNTNYNQSAQICAAENSTMAVIASQADNSFVSSFARNNSATESNPWIGLWCYGNTASSCQWVDGSPVNYTNFQSGYPYANQPAYLDEINERWYTFSSSSTGTYICQQPGMRTFEAPKLKFRAGLTNKAQQVDV